MKVLMWVAPVICLLLLIGCQFRPTETMSLLDEKIAVVHISNSMGIGDMNEDILISFKDKQSLDIFEKAITSAVKKSGKVDLAEPEYDVMVEYKSNEGDLPVHALHFWLGKENEKSTFMYMMDDSVYHTSPQMTNKLRKLILSKHPSKQL
ncbi:hypothetical protein ACFFF5_08375 [Lederbergia wuyishanensis]|uniref:YhfM-like domain-containing protein n=1 Tax=Lederbergia wuyishanensis TaxID=1347903 RepID=A0ABU0D6G6_9BACI|nr:hypothetical protein [Lederbergia wuyishanensis]MCJ8008619.1 hypothetical protein [Lederbergia wuyishanensis]MDQ0343965.1 hypothetical protein [Lederbergia wuyishanensis]